MATKKELTNKIKKIAKQLSGDVKFDEGELIPQHTIKGTGESYFFDYVDRKFIKIARGIEVFVVQNNFDISGRSLVYTFNHDLILIEPEEIQYIGFN